MVHRKLCFLFKVLLLLLFICSGCGGGGGSKTPNLSNITISSETGSVPAGQTLQLTATGTYTNSSSQNMTSLVTWSVSDETYATVSATGLISSSLKGVVTITATYNGLTGTLQIEITDPVLERLDIISPVPSIPLGQQTQLQTIGVFSDGTVSDFTEEATYALNTENASVSDSGLLSNITGDVILTACKDSICEDIEITLNPATLNQITVSATMTTTSVGLVLKFTAIGTYSDGTTIDISNTVDWYSSDNTIASHGTTTSSLFEINDMGTFTARAEYGAVSGTSSSITVDAETLDSITIERVAGEYPGGYMTNIRAIGTFIGGVGSTKDLTDIVTWSVDDSSIGLFPNEKNFPGFFVTGTAGSVSVTAVYNSTSASETIIVNDVLFSGFDIKPDAPANYIPLIVSENNTLTLEIYGLYSDNIARDLSSVCNWYTPSNNILSINSNGGVSGLSTGDWGVIAVIGGIFGIVQPVSVVKEITSFSISATQTTLPTHGDIIFSAEATFDDSTTGDITNYVLWNSDTMTAVLFFENVRNFAHAVSVGASSISASMLINGNTELTSSDSIEISVLPLGILQLLPYTSTGAPSNSFDTTAGFLAVGNYDGGNEDEAFVVTNYVTWASSNENFITISNDIGSKGVIRVNSTTAGPSMISASVDDGTGSTTVMATFGPILP